MEDIATDLRPEICSPSLFGRRTGAPKATSSSPTGFAYSVGEKWTEMG